MATNVLTAQINVTAPGVVNTTNQVSNGLQNVRNSSNQAGQALGNLGRVAQDAPFGFIGIANNLNPLLESFQRLRASAGSLGGAFRALGSSLLGVGGIGFALSAFQFFALGGADALARLFGATDKTKEALEKLNAELEITKQKIDAVGASTQFLNSLGAINVKISGLGNISNLRSESILNQNDLYDANQAFLSAQKDLVAAQSLYNDKRNDDTKKTLDEAQKQYNEAYKQETDLRQKGRILYRSIEFQKVSDAKEALEKQLAANKKFVEDTIAEAKKLSDATKNLIDLKLGIGLFDSVPVQFKKSLEFINKFDTNQYKLVLPVEPIFTEPGPGFKTTATAIGDMYAKEISGAMTESVTFQQVNAEINDKVREQFKSAFAKFGQLVPSVSVIDITAEPGEFLKQITSALDQVAARFQVAQSAAQAASQAFGNAFDSLLSGENALQAIGNALKQLVLDFIKASIQALIFKTITNLLLPGAGNSASGALGGLLSAFGGFRAAGGPVSPGKGYIVGENGPEWFQPNTGGSIVPNGGSGSFAGVGGGSGGGEIVLRVQGNDLVAVTTLAQLYQSRNT